MRSVLCCSALLVVFVLSGCAADQRHAAPMVRADNAGGPWPFLPPAWSAGEPLSAAHEAELRLGPSVAVDASVLRWPADAAPDGVRTLALGGLHEGVSRAIEEQRAEALTRAAQANAHAAMLSSPRIVVWPAQCGMVEVGETSGATKEPRTEVKFWFEPAELSEGELTLRYAIQGRDSRNQNQFITWQCNGAPRLTAGQTWAHRADTDQEVVLVLM